MLPIQYIPQNASAYKMRNSEYIPDTNAFHSNSD